MVFRPTCYFINLLCFEPISENRVVSVWKIRSSYQRCSMKKGVLINFTKFTAKHLCQRPAPLLKRRLWHRCFPANFVKFLRTPFLTEHLWLLLLHSWRWELPFLKLTFTRYVHSLKWYQVKKNGPDLSYTISTSSYSRKKQTYTDVLQNTCS